MDQATLQICSPKKFACSFRPRGSSRGRFAIKRGPAHTPSHIYPCTFRCQLSILINLGHFSYQVLR